jgi:hypothetical protein
MTAIGPSGETNEWICIRKCKVVEAEEDGTCEDLSIFSDMIADSCGVACDGREG